jgi:hypothetical protein
VPREGQLGRRDKDSDATLVEIVDEDGFAVPELSRDRQAPRGQDRVPIEEHGQWIAASAVGTDKDAHEMDFRHRASNDRSGPYASNAISVSPTHQLRNI